MKKHKVLFVAYQFPPLSVGGSYRPYKFVKQLKAHSTSIEPIVLTLSPNSYNSVYSDANLDQEAYREILELGVKVYHCDSEELHSKTKLGEFVSIYFNVFKGREGKFWKIKFAPLFSQIVREEGVKLIYVTCPPFSIGDLIRKSANRLKLPYIVDMRDNWSLWLSQPHGSRIHYWWNRMLERKLYKDSKAVIGVSAEQIKDLQSILKTESEKFHMIPNAFTPKKLENQSYKKVKNRVSIGYLGSFYYSPVTHQLQRQKWWQRSCHRKFFYWPRNEWWIYRSPYFFFQLINLLKEKQPEIEFQIHFAGKKEEWLKEMIREFGLENEVKLHGYLTGNQLNDFYENCDLLLNTSVKVDGGDDYCIASKSFDYLKSGRMVLGLVTKGAQQTFLKNAMNAIIIDPDSIQKNLNELIHFAKSEEIKVDYNKEYLRQFSIDYTTSKLESVIVEIL